MPVDWALVGPALLRDHDLTFPTYHPAAGGGRPAVQPSAGRRVAGVVYELPDSIVEELAAFIGDVYDPSLDTARVRIEAVATRLGDAERFDVTTFSNRYDTGQQVPPTPESIRALVTFAARLGHSHSWMMHLLSFTTTLGVAVPISYDI